MTPRHEHPNQPTNPTSLIALDILGQHYDVIWAPATLLPDRFGHSDPENQEIVLRSNLRGMAALDTLLHECIHAGSHITGVEISEPQTHILGAFLACLFKNNPDLLPYIAERISEEQAKNYQQVSRTASLELASNRKGK